MTASPRSPVFALSLWSLPANPKSKSPKTSPEAHVLPHCQVRRAGTQSHRVRTCRHDRPEKVAVHSFDVHGPHRRSPRASPRRTTPRQPAAGPWRASTSTVMSPGLSTKRRALPAPPPPSASPCVTSAVCATSICAISVAGDVLTRASATSRTRGSAPGTRYQPRSRARRRRQRRAREEVLVRVLHLRHAQRVRLVIVQLPRRRDGHVAVQQPMAGAAGTSSGSCRAPDRVSPALRQKRVGVQEAERLRAGDEVLPRNHAVQAVERLIARGRQHQAHHRQARAAHRQRQQRSRRAPIPAGPPRSRAGAAPGIGSHTADAAASTTMPHTATSGPRSSRRAALSVLRYRAPRPRHRQRGQHRERPAARSTV